MAHNNGEFVNKQYQCCVQFYPWFKFYFPLLWDMVIYDNEFEAKENKIETKNEIKPPHLRKRY